MLGASSLTDSGTNSSCGDLTCGLGDAVSKLTREQQNLLCRLLTGINLGAVRDYDKNKLISLLRILPGCGMFLVGAVFSAYGGYSLKQVVDSTNTDIGYTLLAYLVIPASGGCVSNYLTTNIVEFGYQAWNFFSIPRTSHLHTEHQNLDNQDLEQLQAEIPQPSGQIG